ncbi:hypothetical protein P885DRAFT_64083 [Corynascus similis CBS 632.67]
MSRLREAHCCTHRNFSATESRMTVSTLTLVEMRPPVYESLERRLLLGEQKPERRQHGPGGHVAHCIPMYLYMDALVQGFTGDETLAEIKRRLRPAANAIRGKPAEAWIWHTRCGRLGHPAEWHLMEVKRRGTPTEGKRGTQDPVVGRSNLVRAKGSVLLRPGTATSQDADNVGKMKRTDLETNRIFINEEPALEGALPQHIESLQRILLDFTWTVVDGVDNDDELHRMDDKLPDNSLLRKANRALVEHYKPIRNEARRLHIGKDREKEWETFFLIKFFLPLVATVIVKDKDTRYTARAKFYYEYFKSAQSRPWTLFGQSRGFRQKDRQNLTYPTPDWVAFFPVYDHAGERIPTSERWRLTEAPIKAINENFSYTTLQYLASYGVESNTAGLFRQGRKHGLSDYICFPWLIVEHKRAGGPATEEECYCQAANAGTAAVMMLETLSKIFPGVAKKERRAHKHIPPVVTITTVDKIVRVWITYACELSDDNSVPKYVRKPPDLVFPTVLTNLGLIDIMPKRMDCIWRGDMTSISDLIKFQAVLENTYTWAMREQRPRISTYIDLWKCKHPMGREIRGEPSPTLTAVTEPVVTPVTEETSVLSLGPAALNNMFSSSDRLGLRPDSPVPTIRGQTTESEESLSDEESSTGKSDDEKHLVSDDDQESERSSTKEEGSSEKEKVLEEELVSEEEEEEDLVSEEEAEPVSEEGEESASEEEEEEEQEEEEEEPISEEEEPLPEQEAIPDEGLTPREPSLLEQPTWKEQRSDAPLSDGSTSEQTATLEALTLEEPPALLPLPLHSTGPTPLFDVVQPLHVSSKGSASDPEQAALLPIGAPHVDTTPASSASRSSDIFKKRAYFEHPTRPGMRITVKLPDIRGTDLYMPSRSNTRPPLMGAPTPSPTTPPRPEPGQAPIVHLDMERRRQLSFTTQRRRDLHSVEQQGVQTDPGYLPFYVSIVA